MANDGSILGSMTGSQVDPDMKGAPGPDPFAYNSAAFVDASKKSALATQDEMPFKDLVQSGVEIKYGPKGLSMNNMDPRLVMGMIEKSKRLDTIMGAMQQEGERLQKQREQADTLGGRIGTTLSRLAGNMASAHDLPGWVQGAGRTALELNPTREELTARQMKLGEEEAQIGGAQQRILEAQIRSNEVQAYREAEHQRKVEDDARKASADADRAEDKARQRQIEQQKADDRAFAEKEKVREREKQRISGVIKNSDGNFNVKTLAKNSILDDADKEDLKGEAIAQQKAVKARNEQKVFLQDARLNTRTAIADANNEARKLLKEAPYMNQSAKEAGLTRITSIIQKAEEKLASHKVAIESGTLIDEGQKPKLIAEYQKAAADIEELRKQKAQLEESIKPKQGGATMRAPSNDDPMNLFPGK